MNFEEATKAAKVLNKKPDNDTLLKLYAYYKQATLGDCTTEKPSFYQLEASAKWSAWSSCKGKSKDWAQARYIGLVQKLQTV